MTRHDLEAEGYTIERAMMTCNGNAKMPTGGKTHNVLLLKRKGRQYVTWSFDFPSQQFIEPQLITEAMLTKASGLP